MGQDCRGGYCVPICAYDESPQQAPAPPPRIVERWKVHDDRFGAWAMDEQGAGAYAVAFGELSPSAAERKAVNACEAKGAGRCKVSVTFKNACSTHAWGGGILHSKATFQSRRVRAKHSSGVRKSLVCLATSLRRYAACPYRVGCTRSRMTGDVEARDESLP
ncbi:MAG: DUF4189 domain-containing protein [Nitrospiraceae bacterium]|nr:DUF4189 domain-containing protein [Nitrospiraceae bacterium]